jgi:hypothetical protein
VYAHARANNNRASAGYFGCTFARSPVLRQRRGTGAHSQGMKWAIAGRALTSDVHFKKKGEKKRYG